MHLSRYFVLTRIISHFLVSCILFWAESFHIFLFFLFQVPHVRLKGNQVLNSQNCIQCFKCHKSLGLSLFLWLSWSLSFLASCASSSISHHALLFYIRSNPLNAYIWSKWSKVVQSGPKWSKVVLMIQIRPKWSKVVQNDPKWSKVFQMIQSGPNGPKWSKIIIWICYREILERYFFLGHINWNWNIFFLN